MDRLAQRVKTLRLRRGLSVEQVAVDSGLTVSMWYKIESGQRRPSVDALERVGKALGCTVADLFLPPNCTIGAEDAISEQSGR